MKLVISWQVMAFGRFELSFNRPVVIVKSVRAKAFGPPYQCREMRIDHANLRIPLLQCQDEFETLVRNGRDEEQIECPQCGSTELERVLSLCARE